MIDGKLLAVPQVAGRLNKSSQWVRDAIECGELKAYNLSLGKKRARWFVKISDLEAFLRAKERE